MLEVDEPEQSRVLSTLNKLPQLLGPNKWLSHTQRRQLPDLQAAEAFGEGFSGLLRVSACQLRGAASLRVCVSAGRAHALRRPCVSSLSCRMST